MIQNLLQSFALNKLECLVQKISTSLHAKTKDIAFRLALTKFTHLL